MADVKIFMCILLYVGLLTLVMSSVTGMQYTGLQGFYDFQEYNYYSDFTVSNLSMTDLSITVIDGNWDLSESFGLYPTDLKLMNPFYFIEGDTPYYQATCSFGNIQAANNTYTENFNVSGFNTVAGSKESFLMIDLDENLNLAGELYQWWLVIYDNALWIQSGKKDGFGHVSFQEFNDNIEWVSDGILPANVPFTRNYDTGYRFADSVHDAKIGYRVLFDGNRNAVISVLVNDMVVYDEDIPLTFIDAPLTNGAIIDNRQTMIKTNNLNFHVLSTSQIVSGKTIDRNFDMWSLFDTIIKICTFQVSGEVIPAFMQFILFGIYDLGLLYIFVSLIRGV